MWKRRFAAWKTCCGQGKNRISPGDHGCSISRSSRLALYRRLDSGPLKPTTRRSIPVVRRITRPRVMSKIIVPSQIRSSRRASNRGSSSGVSTVVSTQIVAMPSCTPSSWYRSRAHSLPRPIWHLYHHLLRHGPFSPHNHRFVR